MNTFEENIEQSSQNVAGRLPNIPKFSGRPNEKLRNWLTQYELALEDASIIGESAKIKKMILFLEGEALDWYVEMHQDGKLNTTFKSFIEEMKRRFSAETVTLVKMSNEDLKTYIEKFEIYSVEFKLTDEESKIKHFIKGLQDFWYEKFCGRQFDTFQQVKDLARALLERNSERQTNSFSVYRTTPFQQQNQPLRYTSTPWSDEKVKLYNERRCFTCKKLGHRSRECHEKYQSDPSSPNWETKQLEQAKPRGH